jgi:hypothetical protein
VSVAPATKPAKVTLKTETGARVRVDGRPIGNAPLAAFELAAGKHLLTIVRTGREAVAREIEVTRGQEIKIDQPLHKTTRRRAVPFVLTAAGIFGVITLGGVVGTVILDHQADSKLSAIQSGDQRPTVADDYNRLTQRRGEVLTGTFITGGIGLVIAGAAGALYWLDRPSEEGMRVTPTGSGVAVSGRF